MAITKMSPAELAADSLWQRAFWPGPDDQDDDANQIPVVEPLVEGILDRNDLTWLVGPPGGGKSFLAVDLAACVTAGRPWHGHPVTVGGDVLYLAGEGAAGLSARAVAAGIRQRLVVLPDPPRVGTPEWEGLCEMARDLEPRVVIVDTQARIALGLDENSARDMGVLVDALDELRRATGATIVVIHHASKSGSLRGSTVLAAAAGTILRATKRGDRVTVSCTKRRDGAPPADITLRLVSEGESARLVDDVVVLEETVPRTAESGLPTTTVEGLRAWWDEHEDAWITGPQRDGLVPSSSFHRVRDVLLGDGLVEVTGDGRARRWRLVRCP